MTDTKDDGGPFHPSGKGTDATSMYGSTFRAVAAMHNHAALLSSGMAIGMKCSKCGHFERSTAAQIAVSEADALNAELKK